MRPAMPASISTRRSRRAMAVAASWFPFAARRPMTDTNSSVERAAAHIARGRLRACAAGHRRLHLVRLARLHQSPGSPRLPRDRAGRTAQIAPVRRPDIRRRSTADLLGLHCLRPANPHARGAARGDRMADARRSGSARGPHHPQTGHGAEHERTPSRRVGIAGAGLARAGSDRGGARASSGTGATPVISRRDRPADRPAQFGGIRAPVPHLPACPRKRAGTFVFLDCDDFKSINDTYGHRTGDIILATLGARLRSFGRTDDLVGRLGGDEFGIWFAGSGAREAARLMDRLRNIVEAPIPRPETSGLVGPREISITFSMGAASAPVDGARYSDLLETADARMYEMKTTRRLRA